MNRVPFENTTFNPWSQRENLPAVSPVHKIFAAIALILSALSIPVCLWEGISAKTAEWLGIGLLVLFCAYVVKVAHRTAASALILCTAFFLTCLGMSFTSGALLIALVLGVATGAFLLTVTGRPYLTLLCHVAAFGICYLITRELLLSLLTFIVLPASILMAFATLRGAWRTSIVCLTTGGLLVVVASITLIVLYEVCGTLARDAVASCMESLRESLTDALIAIRDETLEIAVGSSENGAQQLRDQFAALYTDQALRGTVAQLFNLIPALAVVFCMILAYEAHALLLSLYASAGLGAVNTPQTRVITVSLSAAIVYAISFFLMLLLPSDQLASAVVQNLTLILLPVLCVIGIRQLMLLFVRAQGILRFLLIALTFALLCCGSGGTLYVLAMWGSYCTVGDAIRRTLIEKMKSRGDYHDDEN